MENKATISEHLLVAYWSESASVEERLQVESWLKANDENQGLYEQWKKVWEQSGSLADFEAIDVEARWQQFKKEVTFEEETKTVRFFPAVWRYAAALLLVAAAAFLLLRGGDELQMLEVIADNGPQEVLLPDGSQVWLNEQATLRYPNRFENNKRQVELEGEAFFEVTHNPDKPFTVRADDTETRVLGTSFNIREQEGNRLELVLLTGKVRFSRANDWEILAPGEKLIVNEEGAISKSLNGERNFMSWRTRRLEFDSTAMRDVVKDVEALYGVQLSIDSETISNCPLTTTFQNDSLEDVLTTFKYLFDAEVQQTDQGYRIIGGVCPTQSP